MRAPFLGWRVRTQRSVDPTATDPLLAGDQPTPTILLARPFGVGTSQITWGAPCARMEEIPARHNAPNALSRKIECSFMLHLLIKLVFGGGVACKFRMALIDFFQFRF